MPGPTPTQELVERLTQERDEARAAELHAGDAAEEYKRERDEARELARRYFYRCHPYENTYRDSVLEAQPGWMSDNPLSYDEISADYKAEIAATRKRLREKNADFK